MTTRVLVTGGAGFIGCHVVKMLLQRGYEVRVLDNLIDQVHRGAISRNPILSQVELIRADVRDLDRVTAALDGVDSVIHLAAEVGVGQSMYAIDRYVSVNDGGTAVLFQALIDQPVSPRRRRQLDEHLRRGPLSLRRRRAHGRRHSSGPARTRRLGPGRPRRAQPDPDADARMEAAQPRLRLCAHQIRAGTADPDRRARLRHAGRGAAPVQRVRPRPGALQPLHRRARHLRLPAAEPRTPDGVRGRRAAAGLRPRRGRRARLPAGARAPARAGSGVQHRQRPRRQHPAGRRSARRRHGRAASDPRNHGQGSHRRHPPLLRRHLARAGRARLPAPPQLRRQPGRTGRVGAPAARGRPRPRGAAGTGDSAASWHEDAAGPSSSPAAPASSAATSPTAWPGWATRSSSSTRSPARRRGQSRLAAAPPRHPSPARHRRRAGPRGGRGGGGGRRGAVFHMAAQVAVTTSLADPRDGLRRQSARHAARARGRAPPSRAAGRSSSPAPTRSMAASPTSPLARDGDAYVPGGSRLARARHRRGPAARASTRPTAAPRAPPTSTCSTTPAASACPPACCA